MDDPMIPFFDIKLLRWSSLWMNTPIVNVLGFLINVDKVTKVEIWIRIQHLPNELYNDEFSIRVGSSLGKFLKIDLLTSIHLRRKFARICVELDLKLLLKYEGLHCICFKCGRVGHKKD
uniref:Uncharacterized protein n=1 Tax=Cajanus cajan TaxID=3821 RepID=A0A151S4Q3_CAJCA|nr:hypothetical protein KK1_028485 [Cajanus cajan]